MLTPDPADGRPPTLGIVEEFLLLDRWSGHPVPVADAVRSAASLQPALEPDEVHDELLQVQVEVATPACQELDEAGGHLLRLRHELGTAAETHGARLVASGAAPWHDGAAPVTDEAHHDRCIQELLATGTVRDLGQLYWHARVSSRHPTVEIRCADGQLRVDDSVLLAGVVRALVMTALADLRRDAPYPVVSPELLKAACWRAARHGLDDDLHDLRQGRRRRPGDMVVDLLDRVQPALEASHDADQVHKLSDRLLREGCGASRQRQVVARQGLSQLVDFLAGETTATWLD